jgi:hypothetical protein
MKSSGTVSFLLLSTVFAYVTVFMLLYTLPQSDVHELLSGSARVHHNRAGLYANDVLRLASPEISSFSSLDDMLLESSIECYGTSPHLFHLQMTFPGPQNCRVTNLNYLKGKLSLRQSKIPSLFVMLRVSATSSHSIFPTGAFKYLPQAKKDDMNIKEGNKNENENSILIMPHFMGLFFPVDIYFNKETPKPKIFIEEKTFMYGIWHIHNYGHWMHDNMIAMYATMMEHGGIDRNNRIVALSIHGYSHPEVLDDPYKVNAKFVDFFEVFSKHRVVSLSSYDALGSVSK